VRPYLENQPTKNRSGREAQVIDCLPNKRKTLSTHPSTTNNNNNNKRGEEERERERKEKQNIYA
jgi:hypothetical protein